jgi:DNA-binding NarL/FixJ family response regulator
MIERNPVRVVLADDQRLVRESLATLLGLLDGIELIATASDGEEALELTAAHGPDVVLMDLRMPRMDGIEATSRLRDCHPEVRVIALTTYADDESVLGALRAGARGYLTKDASSQDIHSAILNVAAGNAALDPAVQYHVVAALAGDGARAPEPKAQPQLPDDLTPREAEVLALIAEGRTNRQIGAELFITGKTASVHVSRILMKLGVANRAEAAAAAHRLGLARRPAAH